MRKAHTATIFCTILPHFPIVVNRDFSFLAHNYNILFARRPFLGALSYRNQLTSLHCAQHMWNAGITILHLLLGRPKPLAALCIASGFHSINHHWSCRRYAKAFLGSTTCQSDRRIGLSFAYVFCPTTANAVISAPKAPLCKGWISPMAGKMSAKRTKGRRPGRAVSRTG